VGRDFNLINATVPVSLVTSDKEIKQQEENTFSLSFSVMLSNFF